MSHYPVRNILYPPVYRVNDFFYPQTIRHIHPLAVINRHHPVYLHQSVYPVITRNVPGIPIHQPIC